MFPGKSSSGLQAIGHTQRVRFWRSKGQNLVQRLTAQMSPPKWADLGILKKPNTLGGGAYFLTADDQQRVKKHPEFRNVLIRVGWRIQV